MRFYLKVMKRLSNGENLELRFVSGEVEPFAEEEYAMMLLSMEGKANSLMDIRVHVGIEEEE